MENKVNVRLLSMMGQGGSAFGLTLIERMKERDDIMVLSSDMSTPAGLDKFKAAYPDHFMNVGIAEQNMIGVAAGLADEGYKVICVAQACFITMRCFEQVRQYAGYMGIPMILVGIGSGVSLQYMGNTHFALEDLALMRTIPGMDVIAPCDSLEAGKALSAALDSKGSAYIRLYGGTGIPAVHQEDIAFTLGKALPVREGKDVAVLATGSMVQQSLKAAEMLAGEGIECAVVDMHTVKPLDEAYLKECAGDGRLLVTVEEHRLTGGFGSAVADCLQRNHLPARLLMIGVEDTYPLPGSYPYLLESCGLAAGQMAQRIKEAL